MKKYQIPFALVIFMVLSVISACDNKGNKPATVTSEKIKSIKACQLLTQDEVDSLFAVSPGLGKPDSPAPFVQGCVWPAEGAPKLILQVLPAPANVRDSIDPGNGYRMIEVDGLTGQAAAAIQQTNPDFGITEGLAIFGIAKGDYMLTLSPTGLDIKEGSPQFELLKKAADKAIQKL